MLTDESKRPFRCKSGTSDHDSDSSTPCLPCTAVKGIFAPPGSVGACEALACAPGLVDADGISGTPCVTCDGATEYQDEPGQYSLLTVSVSVSMSMALSASMSAVVSASATASKKVSVCPLSKY